jgi:hypothetical protein
MKRQNISKLEGEDSMQRTNRMVLGLIAVFVLGGSLVLFSCGGSDNTTDITFSNAPSQLGNKQFTFTTETDFNVTAAATLVFNSNASRFALIAGAVGSVDVSTIRAVGSMSYGSCIFTVDGSNFISGGPQKGLVVTVSTCQTDQDNNNNLILNDATSTGNGPVTVTINFDPF